MDAGEAAEEAADDGAEAPAGEPGDAAEPRNDGGQA